MTTDTVIPIVSTGAQTFNVSLNNQNCVINLYSLNGNMYFDLTVNNVSLINSRICLDRTPLKFEEYFGFSGQLFFVDQQGTSNPTFDGLGTRYILYYRV